MDDSLLSQSLKWDRNQTKKRHFRTQGIPNEEEIYFCSYFHPVLCCLEQLTIRGELSALRHLFEASNLPRHRHVSFVSCHVPYSPDLYLGPGLYRGPYRALGHDIWKEIVKVCLLGRFLLRFLASWHMRSTDWLADHLCKALLTYGKMAR